MTKLTLKQMVLNIVQTHPKGYLTELAEIVGFSGKNKGSNLNKVLIEEKKEFDNFNVLISLVKHFWGSEHVKIIVDHYVDGIDPKKKTARQLLEFLAVNRQFEKLNELLDRMDNCTNLESKEWAKVYRELYKYEKATEEEMSSLLSEIGGLNVTIPELKVFKKMLLNYCYSQMSAYHMVKILSKEIEQEVELIENNYIKEMYCIRTSQIMLYTNLRVLNDSEAARKHADNIIQSSLATKAFKAYAYFYKGYSYLFTSYESSVINLEKSISLYQEQNRVDDVEYIKELLEFVKVYWGKFEEYHCKYVKNEIYLLINKGIDVTNYLLNNKSKIDSDFYLYLEGCNSKSNKKWLLSMIKYIKKNDLFLANLSKIELLKNGYDEEILNEMIGDDVN